MLCKRLPNKSLVGGRIFQLLFTEVLSGVGKIKHGHREGEENNTAYEGELQNDHDHLAQTDLNEAEIMCDLTNVDHSEETQNYGHNKGKIGNIFDRLVSGTVWKFMVVQNEPSDE